MKDIIWAEGKIMKDIIWAEGFEIYYFPLKRYQLYFQFFNINRLVRLAKKKVKTACAKCGKKIAKNGMADHMKRCGHKIKKVFQTSRADYLKAHMKMHSQKSNTADAYKDLTLAVINELIAANKILSEENEQLKNIRKSGQSADDDVQVMTNEIVSSDLQEVIDLGIVKPVNFQI